MKPCSALKMHALLEILLWCACYAVAESAQPLAGGTVHTMQAAKHFPER